MLTMNAKVCVIEFDRGAVDCVGYPSRLAMVLHELDIGALGDGHHGSKAHLKALAAVILEATRITAEIESDPENESL